METLWMLDRALGRSEIVELTQNRTWKESSVHILLNQLLKKGAIEVAGFIKTGKNYGRSYQAAISMEEYKMMQLRESTGAHGNHSETVLNLVTTLIQEEPLDEVHIEQLEALLQKQKKKRRKKQEHSSQNGDISCDACDI